MSKALKSVTKVLTLGATDGAGGGWASSITGGLTGQAGVDAANAAAKQQAALTAQQTIISQNATALAANNTVDNTVNAIAGGTASTADGSSDLIKKRSASLSSTLGIS